MSNAGTGMGAVHYLGSNRDSALRVGRLGKISVHCQIGDLPTCLKILTTQGTTVIVTNKARRTTLNGLNIDNVFLCIWTPSNGAVLAYRVDQGQICPFLDNSATRREVPLEYA